jgi:arylsulfatase A-like enzyme
MPDPSARPNILFIMSDDHAAHAISCYQKSPVGQFGHVARPPIIETPNMDRIAAEGMRMDNCFCTNSICTPSRATILTGTYAHTNGCTTLYEKWDNTQTSFPKLLQGAGYQTAIFGKWHLGEGAAHCPSGFDDWAVVINQGEYFDPRFLFKGPDGGTEKQIKGYATDIITDMSLDWLKQRDPDRPFCLLTHHKAPHRFWEYDEAHAGLYADSDVPEPSTLLDDYRHRARAAEAALMRVGEHMIEMDMDAAPPEGLEGEALRRWGYQRYMKKYLRCIASIDDNVGRMLDYLDAEGLAENTIVIYTSDQGFFLGDHGWFDKRFMYEESLRMPFLVRYPREIAAGGSIDALAVNVDFAQTLLDYAGVDADPAMQGRSLRPVLAGATPADWRQAVYYRYFENENHHNTSAHYGVRTKRYKLIYYYYDGLGLNGTVDHMCLRKWEFPFAKEELSEHFEPEWELFDLEEDPLEMNSVYNDPAYADVIADLKTELHRIQNAIGDTRHAGDV